MENGDFTFNSEKSHSGDHEQGFAGCRLLERMPAKYWLYIFRVPFRVRHPIIYWTCLIILLGLIIYGIQACFTDKDEADAGNCLALVNIQGVILNAEPVLNWIGKLENMPGVKGILVRVDSPGGGAAASQEIYAALAQLGKIKPIAVSMGSMAASGGLMVSMAGERIFANGSTVTGSIGVRMDIPQVQGLMDKIGVGQETLTTAKFKDAASYMHPLSPEARAYLETVLMNMHEQFVSIVAKGRKMALEKARSLANGKIYTGQQALDLGLVDVLGGQYEAHKWLAEKTGVSEKSPLLKRKIAQKGWIEILRSMASFIGLEGSYFHILEEGNNSVRPVFLYQF